MSDQETRSKDKKAMPREDWFGSSLDKVSAFNVRRVFNGLIVERDGPPQTVVFGTETLVFQDLTQFIDWVQGWYKKP